MTSPLSNNSSPNFQQPFIYKLSPRQNIATFNIVSPSRKNTSFTLPSLIGQPRSPNASLTLEKTISQPLTIVEGFESIAIDNTLEKKSIKGQKSNLFRGDPKRKIALQDRSEIAIKPPVIEDEFEGQKMSMLKLVKGKSLGSGLKSTKSGTNASMLQRSHIEECGKPDLAKLYQRRESIRKIDKSSLSGLPSKELKGLHNFNSYVQGSRNSTLANLGLDSADEKIGSETVNSKLSSLVKIPHRETATLPYLNRSCSPEEMFSVRETPATKKKASLDPFSEIVQYQNNKMTSYLALGAEARHKMLDEVKRLSPELIDINRLMELRDNQIPQAKVKFMNKVEDDESKKKEADLKSRSLNRNALYQYYALSKEAQKKIKSKLEKTLTESSRFLKL